jgi:hypothetical protein
MQYLHCLIPFINVDFLVDQVFGLLRNQRIDGFDETLQNFIYEHTVDLGNVQKNKKREKGEFTGCQVGSNWM